MKMRSPLYGPLLASLALTTCLAAIIIPALTHIDFFPPEPPKFGVQGVAFVLGLPGMIASVLAAAMMSRNLDAEPRWIPIAAGLLFNTFFYWVLFGSFLEWLSSRKQTSRLPPSISLRG